MSELIESVARALCRNDGRAPDMNWDEFVRPARAAVIATLKAIREPTETMVEAAYTGGGGVSDVYCAMIDALLKEKQEELMGKITISTPADGGDVQAADHGCTHFGWPNKG